MVDGYFSISHVGPDYPNRDFSRAILHLGPVDVEEYRFVVALRRRSVSEAFPVDDDVRAQKSMFALNGAPLSTCWRTESCLNVKESARTSDWCCLTRTYWVA